jgi:hypothetical protein
MKAIKKLLSRIAAPARVKPRQWYDYEVDVPSFNEKLDKSSKEYKKIENLIENEWQKVRAETKETMDANLPWPYKELFVKQLHLKRMDQIRRASTKNLDDYLKKLEED